MTKLLPETALSVLSGRRALAIAVVLACSLTLLAPHAAAAQVPVHLWSHGYGPDQVAVTDVATDPAGDIAVVGSFSGTIDFGGGNLVSNGYDAFLAVFDPDGAFLAARQFDTATLNGVAYGQDIIVVAGSIPGVADLGGGPIGTGGTDIVLATYFQPFGGTMGYFWSAAYGDGTSQPKTGIDVAVDPWDNIVLTGNLTGSADFGGGVLGGLDEVYLAAFGPNGSHRWSNEYYASNGIAQVAAVTTHFTLIGITGLTTGNMFVDGNLLPHVGAEDVFVGVFDSSGVSVFSQAYGGLGTDAGRAISFDPSWYVVVGGYYTDFDIDFGGGPLSNNGAEDLFLARLDLNGGDVWSAGYGDGSYQTVEDLAVDASGGIFMSGFNLGTFDLGGGDLVTKGINDLYLAKMDSLGNHQFSADYGGSAATLPGGLALDPVTGDVVLGAVSAGGIAGHFTDFGGGELFGVVVAKFGNEGMDPSVGATVAAGTPDSFVLQPLHPSPFTGSTRVTFDLPQRASTRVRVFDVTGRLVRVLTEGTQEPGRHVVDWDGRDDGGNLVADGVYLCRLDAGAYTGTRKVVHLSR